MKSLKSFLFLLSFYFFLNASFATHTVGGEMGWNCMPNGKYVFYMSFYRDCSGIQYSFEDETIEIVGSPLPTDGSGAIVSHITMKPDSNRWVEEMNGETAPECTGEYGEPFSCVDGYIGILQQFFWKSDPITLSGTPPSQGWSFFWQSVCCRPGDIENAITFGGTSTTPALLLRAIMYPTKNRDDVDPCIDSSPEFIAPPTVAFCRNKNTLFKRFMSYDVLAIDPDNHVNSGYDSLSFLWGYPINPPIHSPVAVDYNTGYDFDSPTPDRSFDGRNVPSTLVERSGHVDFSVFNGIGYEKFLNVLQVDSWRNGKRIASVFREYPITIIDCPTLPSGEDNLLPQIQLDGSYNNHMEIEAVAGDKISIPIRIVDKDSTGIGLGKQQLMLRPLGQNFASDYKDTNLCDLPPCATLKDNIPQYDSVYGGYQIKSLEEINTVFEWQSDTFNLNHEEARIFNFHFYFQDDHCPIPAISSATISIRLSKNYSMNRTHPIMNCIEGGTNRNTIHWDRNNVRSDGFEKWYIYSSADGSLNYSLIDSVANFSTSSYADQSSNASGTSYYYIQAKGSLNAKEQFSLPSDTITTANISDPAVLSYNGECINLKWNTMKSATSSTVENRYYIYREIDLNSDFQLIDSVWNATQYCDATDFCGETVQYFISNKASINGCNYQTDTALIYIPNQTFSTHVSLDDSTFYPRQYLVAARDLEASFQWYDCNNDSLIIYQTSNSYQVRDTGSYAVIIKKRGCVDTSECIPVYFVGLKEIPFQNQLKYFPNPTTGELNISLNNLYQNLDIQIRNIHGQLVQKETYQNQQQLELTIAGKAGIYFVILQNEKGEQANFKVIKQ